MRDAIETQTDLRRTLSGIPNDKFYVDVLGLRHPLGVYNVAYQRVVERLEDAVVAVEALAKAKPDPKNLPDFKVALQGYEHLLYSLLEYVDNCRSILRSLFAEAKRFNSSKPVRKYDQEMFAYRQRLGNIVNAMKHRQARLRGISVYNETVLIPGFYVETAHGDGTVGPDKDIHDSGDTAISFCRDLRYHLVQALRIAELLGEAVKNIIASEPESLSTTAENTGDERMLRLARKISELPTVCFLNEVDMSDPIVEIPLTETGKAVLHVSMRPPPSEYFAPLRFYVKVEFMGDGATRTFKLPYMGKRWDKLVSVKLARR